MKDLVEVKGAGLGEPSSQHHWLWVTHRYLEVRSFEPTSGYSVDGPVH